MELHLGGQLAFYDPEKRSRVTVPLETDAPLREVLCRLGIPEAEVGLAAVNRQVVRLEEAVVRDSDRVDLYPPMDGGAPLARAATRVTAALGFRQTAVRPWTTWCQAASATARTGARPLETRPGAPGKMAVASSALA
jgi:sulfur carrier protein ThiS